MTFYSILALSSFLLSLLGTRILIQTLRRRTVLLDRPNMRSNHTTPTPRGGGIAVVFTLIICLAIADIHFGIILCVLLLAAVSLLDDLIDLPPLVRLMVQVMAAVVALSTFTTPIFSADLPVWLDKAIAGFLWVWFTNLFNFMDGIDGLAATETICIGIGLCLVSVFLNTFPDALSIYGLIIAAAACGFIWWNWHPARIFLGDVGSIPIGFLLGYLLLLSVATGYGYAALILPAYYFADSTITLLRRLSRGQKIWVAHSEHYYQKAVRRNRRRHDTVVRYIFGVNLLLIFLATRSVLDPELAILYVAVAYLAVCMLLGFFAHITPRHHPHFRNADG